MSLVSPDSLAAGRLLSRYGWFLGAGEGDYQHAKQGLDQALAISRSENDIVLEMRTLAITCRVELSLIQSQIDDVDGRLGKLYDALETGSFKPVQLAPRVEALTEKKARLEQWKADTEAKSLRQALELASTDVIDAYVNDLRALLEESSIMEQKAFLRSFIQSLEVAETDLTITYTIPIDTLNSGEGVTEDATVLPTIKTGSPSTIKGRTFTANLMLTFLIHQRQERIVNPRKNHRNPIALAREWRSIMDDAGLSRSGISRQLGVSRARVTQVLRLLELAPVVLASVEGFGDPMSSPRKGERTLRPLVGLPTKEQAERLNSIIARLAPGH